MIIISITLEPGKIENGSFLFWIVFWLTLKTTHRENGTVTKTSPQEMAVSSQPHTVIILGIINSFISNKSYFELNLQHEKTVWT